MLKSVKAVKVTNVEVSKEVAAQLKSAGRKVVERKGVHFEVIETPFTKPIFESMNDLTGENLQYANDCIKDWGRTDFVSADGSVVCAEKDAGSRRIEAPGLVGALNNGIDLAMRSLVGPKKITDETKINKAMDHITDDEVLWNEYRQLPKGDARKNFLIKLYDEKLSRGAANGASDASEDATA